MRTWAGMCHQARRRNCVARVSYYVESLFACDDAVRYELLAFSRPSRGLGRLVPTTTFSLKQAWVLIGVYCSSGIHLAIYPSIPCGLVRVKIALCLRAIQHRHQGGDAATGRFEGRGKATSDLRGTCRVSPLISLPLPCCCSCCSRCFFTFSPPASPPHFYYLPSSR